MVKFLHYKIVIKNMKSPHMEIKNTRSRRVFLSIFSSIKIVYVPTISKKKAPVHFSVAGAAWTNS